MIIIDFNNQNTDSDFLLLINREYSSCHHLVTLSQFLFITFCTFSFKRFKPKVPIK